MSAFPFRIKQRTHPMHIPVPRSVTLYIWIAAALICVSAVACR